MGISNPDYKVGSAGELVSVHYHKLFQNQEAINPVEGYIEEHSNGRQINKWLREFGIQQNNVLKNSRIAKITRKWRELNSKYF